MEKIADTIGVKIIEDYLNNDPYMDRSSNYDENRKILLKIFFEFTGIERTLVTFCRKK